MLRNLRRTSVLSFIIGLGVLALAGLSCSAPGELSNTPKPPTLNASLDGIALNSGNDCKDNNVGLTDGAPG